MRRALLASLLAVCALFGAPARAQERPQQQPASPVATDDENVIESMRRARNYFEYGDYASTARILKRLIDTGKFESAELRAEAYRLLGLSYFYQTKRGDAYQAFLELAYVDPDAELDPFYVPPAAVALLEQVKKDAEKQLAPLRAQRRAEEEARRRLAQEEANRRRQREREEEQRRLSALAPTIERRVVQREFWVSLLPFGVGQLQNGDRMLGIALATTQVIAGATSGGSALLIETLRDPSTGKFGGGVYPLAQRLNVAKWVGAALFYGLWLGGALHASLNFQPETQLPDRLVTSRPADALPAPLLPPGLAPLTPAQPATAPSRVPVAPVAPATPVQPEPALPDAPPARRLAPGSVPAPVP